VSTPQNMKFFRFHVGAKPPKYPEQSSLPKSPSCESETRYRCAANHHSSAAPEAKFDSREGSHQRRKNVEAWRQLPSHFWRLYLKMHQIARNPSFQPIFLPSRLVRPSYETGISQTLTCRPSTRNFAIFAVISGSKPNRFSSTGIA
jgi:hypothetical protein